MDNAASRFGAALAERYRIEEEVGAGGMATVYLAEDLKHHRKVAIKVLHPELAAVLGAERFLGEIRVTANLQHPHILGLLDSGEAGGRLFYVMPYVAGESLRARLERERQLPVADAVRLAREVASALDYAHRNGVVHRDIKPENILLHDGAALVADFGIALAVSAAGGQRMTQTGVSLGTPQYMSPEQALGERTIDARSDVYALGTVLYEMLTGEPPFTGPTSQAIVSKLLADPPRPPSELRRAVPPNVNAAVLQALEKVPADRFGSAAEFAQALGNATFTHVSQPWAGLVRVRWYADWRTWIAVFALVAAGVMAITKFRPGEVQPSPVARFLVNPPEGMRVGGVAQSRVALSPDGTALVYVGISETGGQLHSQLFRRALDTVEPVPISGSDSAEAPFFSPDGKWIGFYQGRRIVKIPAAGGTPVILADSASFRLAHATWTDGGEIIFLRQDPSQRGHMGGMLLRMPETGGPAQVVYRDSAYSVAWPTALPGGRTVLLAGCPAPPCDKADLVAVDLASRRLTVLQHDVEIAGIWFVAPHWLLLLRSDGVVTATRFDPDRLTFSGQPFPVLQGITSRFVGADLAVSNTGLLATIPGGAAPTDELVWLDRQGRQTPITHQPRKYLFPRVSPDGKKIAVEIHEAGGTQGHIWVYDIGSETLSRVTSVGHDTRPVWSPDGRHIAYSSERGDSSGIYVMPIDRSEPERPVIIRRGLGFAPLSWSRQGQWLATDMRREGPGEPNLDLYAVPLGGGKPALVLGTGADERRPVISPDGKWVAYTSNESGRVEVYVTPFPGPGGRYPVSADGGDQPVWNPSGHELFYRGADGWLTAAEVRLGVGDVSVVRRERLFPIGISGDYALFGESPYDVAPDGQHFVFIKAGVDQGAILITTNLPAEIARLSRQ